MIRSPHLVGGKALLAAADASGSLKVYEMVKTAESLSLRLACETQVVTDGLALSLEWSTREGSQGREKNFQAFPFFLKSRKKLHPG